MQDVDNGPGALGDQFGRLENDGVAVGKCRSDLPRRDGDREIPWRDDADDADRFARDLDTDARTHARHQFARQAQRLAGEEIEYLGGAHGLANTLGQRLAFLARQGPADFIFPRGDLVRCLPQRAGTRPCRKRRFRRRDGLPGLLGAGGSILADDIAGIGWIDVAGTGLAHPLAIDEILSKQGHVAVS